MTLMPKLRLWILLLFLNCGLLFGDLRYYYYNDKCPQAEQVTKSVLSGAVKEDPRLPASILRLHFHDCFVQGCDGSILLDDTSSIESEKNALPNKNSVIGFEVIDSIKTELEESCPGVVSCADILAIAARDSVVLSGGPSWELKLGRKDSNWASQKLANSNLPAPDFNFNYLLSKFEDQGLTLVDLVTLSGAHTIGAAQCSNFKQRIYGRDANPTIDKKFLYYLKKQCPQIGGDNKLSALDWASPYVFDNHYFQNIMVNTGLLGSDQVLYSHYNDLAMEVVKAFAKSNELFFSQFATSMFKMSNLNPLTDEDDDDKREVRENCRKTNSELSSESHTTSSLSPRGGYGYQRKQAQTKV